MIEVHRVVENQAQLNSYRATQDLEKAAQLELLIERTKPPIRTRGWHDLVATPFRYDLPVPPEYSARFRPPFSSKNVFYASVEVETALYEYSYHLMRQRVHLQISKRRVRNETGVRTRFSVDADDISAMRIHECADLRAILDRSDYSASHEFVRTNPQADFIIYPSVRDPERRDNAAIMDIRWLSRKINGEHALNYFYDYRKKAITWIALGLTVSWPELV